MKKLTEKIDWKKSNGLVPAIIQDADTGAVLMLGYMNKESLNKTLATKRVWFYSRTKKRLWMKGEKSKNILSVLDIKLDCDDDSLLIKVEPAGPTCHTGDYSCFREDKITAKSELSELFKIIQNRKAKMPEKSYTASLFKEGLDKMSLKVAEESLEVIHAAQKQTKKRLVEETVDLLYHLFVLLAAKKINLSEVEDEIKKRQNK
jgi:phosphoribosyl-ATP pyrophosphohydrolase/phosphoribosyl-AMP cyclohydrolase